MTRQRYSGLRSAFLVLCGVACITGLTAAGRGVEALGAQAPAATHPEPLAIGSPAPDFSLQGVDGKTYTLASFKDRKVLAVVFTAVHCPTAEVYEERIKQLVSDYQKRDVAFVAIQPNNALAVRLAFFRRKFAERFQLLGDQPGFAEQRYAQRVERIERRRSGDLGKRLFHLVSQPVRHIVHISTKIPRSPLPLAGEVGARRAPGKGGASASQWSCSARKRHPHPPSAPSPASGRRKIRALRK